MRRPWGGLVCVALFAILGLVVPAVAAAEHSPIQRPHTHTAPRASGRSESYNWAGYDVTSGPFTTVTATWTQPRVKSSGSRFADAAFWVGLDGDGSDTVEQIGTEGYSEGGVGYDAWYEMYPDYPVVLGMSIHAGDVLTATVTWAKPAVFTLSLVNHTTGASYTTTQLMAVPPALASAEVIAEAPSTGFGEVVPLADFTLCSFSDCRVDGQPISAYDWTAIDMVDRRAGKLTRSTDLGADGASFAVSTDVTAPHTTVRGVGAAWHSAPVTLHFSATDAGSGVAATSCSLDGGATWVQGATATVAAPADHSNDGAHTVLYRSTDKVGNVERKRSCVVRIDTQQPTPLAPLGASVVRGRTATIALRVDDPRPGSPTATATVFVRDAGDRLVSRAKLPPHRVDAAFAYRFVCRLSRGRYTFRVAATDAAGNRQTATASNTLVVR